MPPDKGNVKKSPAVKQETNIQGKSTTTKRDLKETSGKSTLTIKSIYGSHSTTDSKTKTLSVSKTKEQPQKDDPESKLEPQKEMSEKKRNSTVQKSRQALGKVKSETGKGKLSSQDVKNVVTTQSHTLVKNVVKTMSYHIPAKNTDSGDTLTHRSQRSYRTTTQGTPEKVRTKVKKENTASSTKPQPKDRSHYQTWRDTRQTITKTKDTNIKLKTTAGNVKTLSTELKNKMIIKESRKHRNNQVDKESRNKEVYKESRNKLGDKYSRTKPVIEKTRQKPVDKERQNKPLDKNEPTSKLDNTTPEAGTKKLHRERTRTRTLSPTEVKMAQSIQAEIEKEQQMKREKSESSTKPSPSRTMANDTSNTDDEEEISDSIDKDDYEDDFEDYEPDFEDHTNSDISDKEAVGIGTDSANTMTDVDDDDDDDDDDDGDGDDDVVVDDDNDDSSNHDISEDGAVGLTPRQHPLVEEEKKLDSGNYDLADRRRKEREMQEIKMALERENLDLEERRKKSSGLVGSLVIPVDEGFEEEKVEETKCSVSTSLHHTQFINFANARKRQIEKRASAKSKKRGEELLDMIRLDAMSYSLFDIAPIPYEVYMKSYGRSNAVQALAQTNEDNLSEEVQTDEIICKNKWTQKPISFCTKIDSKVNDKKKDLLMFSQEHLGVGGDFLEENALGWSNRIKTDSARFNQFLSTTGQVMLILLEESYTQNGGELIMNPVDLGFSDGFTSLGVSDVPFLAERAVTSICFPHHLTTMLLTVHQRLQRAASTDSNPVLGRSLICVWNTLEPSSPQKILVAGQEVTACYLESSHAGLVFGGLADGSVCIWDLREPSSYHTMVTAADQSQWIIRSPTYNTAEILREEGHLGPVVALQPFLEAESKSDTYYSNELSPMQVCSLEESGIIMVWTVIQSQEKGSKSGMSQQDLGLAHWGRVLLHRSSTIRIQDTLSLDSVHRNNLQCYDLRMDVQDTEHLYVATNTGQVVHCLKSGGKPSPRTYIPNCDGFTSAKCIETCPFDQPFFLVGGVEGSVRLHSRASEKPLTMLAGTGDVLGQGPPIIALQWSRCRPCVFFALDTSSRIHVWDLSAGDMYPQYSVPFSDKTITAIQLSPLSESGKETSQLVLATECGKVEIHNLKPELNYRSTLEFNKELDTFLRYTSIL